MFLSRFVKLALALGVQVCKKKSCPRRTPKLLVEKYVTRIKKKAYKKDFLVLNQFYTRKNPISARTPKIFEDPDAGGFCLAPYLSAAWCKNPIPARPLRHLLLSPPPFSNHAKSKSEIKFWRVLKIGGRSPPLPPRTQN